MTTQSTIPTVPNSPESCASQHGSDGNETNVDPSLPTEILRITPWNREAKLSMHMLLELQARQELDPHHAAFIHYTREGRLDGDTDTQPIRDSDETSDEEPASDQGNQLVKLGYFSLNLQSQSTSIGLAWKIGRGSGKRFGSKRDVEIMIVAPTKPAVHGVAATHILLDLHPRSRAWMLRAIETFSLDGEMLTSGATVALSKPCSMFEVRGMVFFLEFQIDTPAKEEQYISEHNAILAHMGADLPLTPISGIPFPNDIKLTSAIFRHGLGQGSFGSVFEGFDPRSGHLRAIKKLTIGKSDQHELVDAELTALRHFADSTPGIVKFFEAASSRGTPWPKDTFPLEIYIVMDRGMRFNRVNWRESLDSNSKLQVTLFDQLLQGLGNIHQKCWIHRDINPANILYYPSEKRAALCDFGKVSFQPTNTNTAIANWMYLPPEMKQDGKTRFYGQKIDVWMLGFALFQSWYQYDKRLQQRLPNDYKNIRQAVYHSSPNMLTRVTKVLLAMTAWDPNERPHAKKCITDLQEEDFESNKKHKS